MQIDRYGPWALITGGSDGIGGGFARHLAAAGINLLIVSRSEAKLSALAEAIRATPAVEMGILACDLSEDGALDAIRRAAEVLEIGLLVCNVGAVFGAVRFLRSDIGDVERTLRFNNWAHVTLLHHFERPMLDRRQDGIVLIASMAGNAGGASTVLYGAGKASPRASPKVCFQRSTARALMDSMWSSARSTRLSGRASRSSMIPGSSSPISLNSRERRLPRCPTIRCSCPAIWPRTSPSSPPRREAAESMTAMLNGFKRAAKP